MPTYQIQMASANDKDRYDSKPSKKWETIVEQETAEEALLYLLEGLNDESIVVDNFWLRLVKPNGEIVCM